MSGSVLASIIQNCKACNKCFTSSPQDATPVQGAPRVGLKRWRKGRRGEETGGQERRRRRRSEGESKRVFSCISKHVGKILRMLFFLKNSFLLGCVFEDAGDALNAIHWSLRGRGWEEMEEVFIKKGIICVLPRNVNKQEEGHNSSRIISSSVTH